MKDFVEAKKVETERNKEQESFIHRKMKGHLRLVFPKPNKRTTSNRWGKNNNSDLKI